MINLYLDDVRTPPIGYVLAKTVEEAIDIIENNQMNLPDCAKHNRGF